MHQQRKRRRFGKTPLHHIHILLIVGITLTLLIPFSACADDLQGAQDHPLFKRYAGSEIVGYDTKRFDQYTLQTATFKRYNIETKQREFAEPPLTLEGAVTRIWYEAPGDTGSLELSRNYRNELTAEGYQILYDSSRDPAATNWSGFLNPFGEKKISTSRSSYIFLAADYKGLYVLSARKPRPEGDIYVSLTTVAWAKNDATYKARKGAYAAVDIIEVRPMQQNMVRVTAEEMSKQISLNGRVALYGIYFDTGKAIVKEASKPALEEIARLLKQEPGLALHVVGHTDNVGGFEDNLDLSRRRAEAVKAVLMDEYGINAKRLIPNGVAYLAPVASNLTEEGRAKNRRVELVPQ